MSRQTGGHLAPGRLERVPAWASTGIAAVAHGPEVPDPVRGRAVLFLCTGNAARSVIAGAALAVRLPEVRIQTAGTLVVDGLPVSTRTRAALAAVGLSAPEHRSRQAHAPDLAAPTVIVGLAPEHVAWVRREHPRAASRTGTLKRLCRDLPAGPAPLSLRIAELDLAQAQLAPWEEVTDPGGGDTAAFVACAREIVALVGRLAVSLQGPRACPGAPRTRPQGFSGR